MEQLSPLHFEILHRAGIRHQNADGVSRIPCRQCGRPDEATTERIARIDGTVEDDWSPMELSKQQREDPEIAEIRELLMKFPDKRPTWQELEGISENTMFYIVKRILQ